MIDSMMYDRDWFKSSYSGSQGDSCVEVARRAGSVLVRDSKEGQDGARVTVSSTAWKRFVGFTAM